jgi:hypothetical protein
MKYPSIDLLDLRVEKIISNTVKHYYTDWKHYDRPKYMKCKGSTKQADKELILIARTCGTYLVKMADIKAGDNWANTLIEYYNTQETADFYYINLQTLEVKKIQPETIKAA